MSLILPGGEPFFFPGGDIGCLLTHGFTATPQEVRGLGEHLANHGYTILGIRLSGHSTRVEDMAHTRYRDWIASVEDGIHMLSDHCGKMVMVGFSTGGAISLLLSTHFPVVGVVALSTPIELPPNPRLAVLRPLLRPLSLVLRVMKKRPREWADPQAASERVAYTAYPLRSILELEVLLDEMRQNLPNITVPVLLMHSRNDRYIPYAHMTSIYEELGTENKTMKWVVNSSHIITCDAEREVVFTATTDFIRRITG